MTEAKTRPISLRVSVEVLAALEDAGLSPVDIAREALEREATKARRLAALERIRSRTDKVGLGSDATAALRRDRERDG